MVDNIGIPIIVLNNIIGFVIVIRFYNNLLKKNEITKINKMIWIIIINLVAISLNILYENIFFSLGLSIGIYFIIANKLYEGTIQTEFTISVFITAFSFIAELITGILLSDIFGNEISEIRSQGIHLIIGGLISKLILMILLEIFIRVLNKKISKISNKSWLLIISIPINSIVIMGIMIYNSIMDNQVTPITMILCISLMYINIVIFYLFDSIAAQIEENNKYKMRELSISMEVKQYKNIIESYEKIKRFKHDTLMHIGVLRQVIKSNENAKALQYIDNLSEELTMETTPIISGNLIVDALLNSLASEIEKNNIKFVYEIKIPKTLNISDMDICTILGNLLINAIESCEKVDKKQKLINLKMHYNQNIITIKLENSYNANSINKRAQKLVSSKNSPYHGFGLVNVKEVSEKYGGVYKNEEKDMFISRVAIPNLKKM